MILKRNSNAAAAGSKWPARQREGDMVSRDMTFSNMTASNSAVSNLAISRRHILAGALASPAVIAASRLGMAAPAQMLKISHQFPGGTIDEGDFRDRICLKFAAELEKRTNGAVGAQVYPNSSLMNTIPQFSPVRNTALHLPLYPI